MQHILSTTTTISIQFKSQPVWCSLKLLFFDIYILVWEGEADEAIFLYFKATDNN